MRFLRFLMYHPWAPWIVGGVALGESLFFPTRFALGVLIAMAWYSRC